MNKKTLAGLLVVAASSTLVGCYAAETGHPGYQDTPMLPGNKWHVHDSARPEAPVVTPGTFSTQDAPGKPPSDATVLFDGTHLDHWVYDKDGSPANWKVENGYMEVRGGGIHTKDKFGDCQIHVEWFEPTTVHGTSQERGNSGVFPMGQYELQVLDSYNNPTYADGAAGGIYGQYPPQVNPILPAGQWQVYDIIWEAPRFQPDGKLISPAYETVFFNGVLVHNHTALLGATGHRTLAQYHPGDPTGPLGLQDHGNPVHYRNIWVRPIKNDTETE